jgi:hypothetical protein
MPAGILFTLSGIVSGFRVILAPEAAFVFNRSNRPFVLPDAS